MPSFVVHSRAPACCQGEDGLDPRRAFAQREVLQVSRMIAAWFPSVHVTSGTPTTSLETDVWEQREMGPKPHKGDGADKPRNFEARRRTDTQRAFERRGAVWLFAAIPQDSKSPTI